MKIESLVVLSTCCDDKGKRPFVWGSWQHIRPKREVCSVSYFDIYTLKRTITIIFVLNINIIFHTLIFIRFLNLSNVKINGELEKLS